MDNQLGNTSPSRFKIVDRSPFAIAATFELLRLDRLTIGFITLINHSKLNHSGKAVMLENLTPIEYLEKYKLLENSTGQ